MADSAQTTSGHRLQIELRPISELIFNKTTAYDICVSLITDELGLISYKVFKPLAERTELNVPLEQWIFKNSCRKIQEMIRKNIKFDYITLNISARYAKMDSYAFDLLGLLKETGISPEKICLEILETDLKTQPDDLINKLHELKREGFKIALDDYSAAYMPLSRIDAIPADIIKLDKTLTNRLVVDRKAEQSASAIIKRAKEMKCEVIGKDVDTEKLRYLLMVLGCGKIQNYMEEKKSTEPAEPKETEES